MLFLVLYASLVAQIQFPYQRTLPKDFIIDTAYYGNCHGLCWLPFEKRSYLDLDGDNTADSVFYKLREPNTGPNYWEHLWWMQVAIRLSTNKLFAIIPAWIYYESNFPSSFFVEDSFGDAFHYVKNPCTKKRGIRLVSGAPLGMPFDSILNVKVFDKDPQYLFPSFRWMDSLVAEQKSIQWIEENMKNAPNEMAFWEKEKILWSRWFVVEFLENRMSISTVKNEHCGSGTGNWYYERDSSGNLH